MCHRSAQRTRFPQSFSVEMLSSGLSGAQGMQAEVTLQGIAREEVRESSARQMLTRAIKRAQGRDSAIKAAFEAYW